MTFNLTISDVREVGGSRAKDEIINPFVEAFNQHSAKFGLNNKTSCGQFLGQICVESANFSDLDENLGYSAKRLTQVWPRRFPSLSAAEPYARNPEALANKTYGGRMGNKAAGDGWKYRGRGLKMLTGLYNYSKFQEWLERVGLGHLGSVIQDPDLVTKFPHAFLSAVWFWDANGLNRIASDTTACTKKINGGTIGLNERIKAVMRAWAALADNDGEGQAFVRGNPIEDDLDRDGDGIADFAKVGKRHGSVANIHRALDELGFPVKPEEFYSQATAQSMLRFQQAQGLDPDGVFGKNTREAMEVKLGKSLTDL